MSDEKTVNRLWYAIILLWSGDAMISVADESIVHHAFWMTILLHAVMALVLYAAAAFHLFGWARFWLRHGMSIIRRDKA